MDSRTRLLTAIKGEKPDHLPLYCWVFGFTPPKYLQWDENAHWYTMRLEHIHTLPEHWDVNQDFKRVDRFLSIGLDDVLDISVPWNVYPDVAIKDCKFYNFLIYEVRLNNLVNRYSKFRHSIEIFCPQNQSDMCRE